MDIEWIDLIESKHPALHRVVMAAMTDSDKSYLVYMAARLLEMKRLLKSTGSIYLHCDPTMSHYLKLIMDAILGKSNFRNEIIWHYHMGYGSKKNYRKKHDVLLFYTRSQDYLGVQVRVPRRMEGRYNKVDTDGRRYHVNGVGKRFYEDEGIMPDDVWSYLRDKKFTQLNSQAKERTGYPTQKPLALLDRIIKASSNKGDVVLDPFCGCATTCVAADKLDREWVGIDISDKAYELVNVRLRESQGAQYLKDGSKQISFLEEVIHRTDIPQRTDLGDIPRYNCKENKTWLYGSQQGNCAHCGTHFEMRNLEVDHIIARSKGGTDHIDNLQMLCGSCNRIKGNRGMKYLRERLLLAA